MPGDLPKPVSGSPGLAGYALAIGVSLLVLGLEVPLGQALIALSGRSSWSEVGDAFAAGATVILIGLIPAAVIGPVGALVVHLMTLGVTAQSWHVFAAGFVGLSAGALVLVFHSLPLAVMLGVATAIGRLAAVPLARERARRLELDRPPSGYALDGAPSTLTEIDYGPDQPLDRGNHLYDD